MSGSRQGLRARAAALLLSLTALIAAPHAVFAQAVQVTVSQTVVPAGSPVEVTLTGPAGQFYAVAGSATGSGLSYGGVQLQLGTDAVVLAQGVIDGTGRVVVSVTPPFRGSVLDRYYLIGVAAPNNSFLPPTASTAIVVKNGDLLSGVVGPAGPEGPAGPAGATGAQGPAGAAGADGAAGPAGPAGPQGATGADGAAGPAGPAGADGAAGPAGPAGADGAQGPAGADGAVGPQGPAGADGAVGPQGPAGSQGALGPQGPAGADGATGAQGPQGVTGLQGPIGPQGPAGPQGAVGAQGLPGLGAFAVENATVGTTNSTTYTSTLGGTPGTNPSVTVSMTGSSALVMLTAQGSANGNNLAYIGFAVSGDSTVAASDQMALVGNSAGAATAVHYVTGLTPGNNTFTLAYRVSGGNGSFSVRNIVVIPMP